MVLADFGVWQVFLSMIYFFLFFIWIMLLFQVFGDLFRDKELSGVAKALWLFFVIVAPYLGVFVYLIVRGQKMGQNQVKAMEAQQQAIDAYIRETAGGAGGASAADELARLSELHKAGTIDDAEFAKLKAKIIG